MQLKIISIFAKKTIKRFNLSKNDLIVDIGSNDGSLINYFKKKKIKVLGVDPAKNVTDIANRRGIHTITSLFNKKIAKQISNNFQKAKIVTAFNVFSHSENHNEMLDNVK